MTSPKSSSSANTYHRYQNMGKGLQNEHEKYSNSIDLVQREMVPSICLRPVPGGLKREADDGRRKPRSIFQLASDRHLVRRLFNSRARPAHLLHSEVDFSTSAAMDVWICVAMADARARRRRVHFRSPSSPSSPSPSGSNTLRRRTVSRITVSHPTGVPRVSLPTGVPISGSSCWPGLTLLPSFFALALLHPVRSWSES
jgi:hypothetical protein